MVHLLMGVLVIFALASLVPLELGRRGLATDRDVGWGAPARVLQDPAKAAAANRIIARSSPAESLQVVIGQSAVKHVKRMT